MKLYYSPTSPYVRKVVACAIIRGLDGRIERHVTNPHESPDDLLADNPLSKVPCLVTDDGLSLFGSQLICEYLDSVGDELQLFPAHGAPRWRALKFQSLGDGILDAAVPWRGEQAKPQEAARDQQIARYRDAIDRAVDTLGARSAAQDRRYRLDHGGLRAGVSGFPLCVAPVAAGTSEAGGVV